MIERLSKVVLEKAEIRRYDDESKGKSLSPFHNHVVEAMSVAGAKYTICFWNDRRGVEGMMRIVKSRGVSLFVTTY